MAQKAGLVLVTGASGYIATHIIQQLLQQGYRVRGTVRNLTNDKKTKPLYQLCPEASHKLELVEADLVKADTWSKAVRGCTYVMHVASPVVLKVEPGQEDDIIKSALNGTLNVLQAARDAGTVRRVVLTSSTAAVTAVSSAGCNSDRTFTEEDWTEGNMSVYARSKTLAEKAAWDFVRSLSDEDKFELSVINPVFCVGPVLCRTSDVPTMEMIKRILNEEIPFLPRMNVSVVDVRDVATAHIIAMTLTEAAGNRHILSTKNGWIPDVARVIQEEFWPQGYRIYALTVPDILMRVAGWFNEEARLTLPYIGKVVPYDNTRMKDILGIRPRDVKQTVLDGCYSLIELGIVKKKGKYRSRNEYSATKEN